MVCRLLSALIVTPAVLLLAVPETRAAESQRPPNIIVIVSDDQGYAELGCYGNKDIPTPQIDSLAKNGVRFTDGHVSCPVCSPTRAGLLTGRYQQRFGHEFNPGPQAADHFGLPLSEKTLADRLKAAGYATGMVGKWHLGFQPKFHPLRRGFDEFFGFLGGAHPYFKDGGEGKNAILRGEKPVHEDAYLTDALTREAVAFIDRHQKKPFFLYLTYNAVHAPMEAPPKYLKRVAHINNPKRQTFAAMLTALDDGVGTVLAALEERKLTDNTLIFYNSDNGGPTPQTTSRNGPLRATKGHVFEGGIRVPMLMQWKGRIPAGQVYASPVITLDIVPTALAAAGAPALPAHETDGANLLPFIAGQQAQSTVPHEFLFWRFGGQRAVRSHDWKLVQLPNQPPALYDLSKDIGEEKNLADQEPERVKSLQAAFDKWNRELAEPLWKNSRKKKAKASR